MRPSSVLLQPQFQQFFLLRVQSLPKWLRLLMLKINGYFHITLFKIVIRSRILAEHYFQPTTRKFACHLDTILLQLKDII